MYTFSWLDRGNGLKVAQVRSVAGKLRQAYLINGTHIKVLEGAVSILDERPIKEYAIGSLPETKANCFLRFNGYRPAEG